MKRRILSILTALALCLSLLPGTAWAEGETVTVEIASVTTVTSLESGIKYVAGGTFTGVERNDNAVNDYIQLDGNTLTVHGTVTIHSSGGMWVSGGTLIITGTSGSSLELVDCASVALAIDNNTTVILADAVSLNIAGELAGDTTGSSMKTTDSYTGNITVTGKVYVANLELKTTGTINISGPYTNGVTGSIQDINSKSVIADDKLWAVGELTNDIIDISDVDKPTCYETATGKLFYTPDTGEIKVEDTLNALVAKTENGVTNYTVYRNVTLTDAMVQGGLVSENTKLIISKDATLTVPSGKTLTFNELGEEYFTNNGTIKNEGTISIEGNAAKTENISQAIRALGLEGNGTVTVTTTDEDGNEATSTYTNSGGVVDTGDLDFTQNPVPTGAGYEWKATEVGVDDRGNKIYTYTLTLSDDVDIQGKVTLPDATVTIVVEGDCKIKKLDAGEESHTNLTISAPEGKTGKLTVAEHIEISGDKSSLTVDSGATLEVEKEGVTVSGSGSVNGTITVNGTLIAVGSDTYSAVRAGKVIVNNGGTLDVSGETGVSLGGRRIDEEGKEIKDDGSIDYTGAFTLKEGGTFKADCQENAISVSSGGSAFDSSVVPAQVISTPPGYLPAGREPELSKTGQSIIVAGGEKFTISADNVPKPVDPENPTEPTTPGTSVTPNIPTLPTIQPSTPSIYPIYAPLTENGTVTVTPKNAGKDETVTVTIMPDPGYTLDDLTATDSQGEPVRLTDQGGGVYTFTMPGRAVTVTAVFAPLPEEDVCDGGADCPSRNFTDVGGPGTWYHEAVDYVLRTGLMSGYTGTSFGPDDNLSRAQFAQILYNREGGPAVTGSGAFTDVAPGQWYTPAVTWAAASGIVGGYGDGRFGPGRNITREQLAVMLWRYAGSPAATDTELRFTDADEASGYALDALCWAAENAVLNGYGDGRLGPNGLVTRAQAAQMLMNFLSK